MSQPGPESNGKILGDLGVAVAMLGMVVLLIMPLPAMALDMLLAVNLCATMTIFLVAIYIERPLDFSAFPSLLLIVTLFRLCLNVASTRRILLHGGEGTEAAGGVIHAFGEFAVGGNFVVGAVVFLILVIVNFIVITKGADRISEVAARFTLDSMPGKQMAIDADLGAGLITEKDAKKRRREIEMEADFHGAMDGASKFVRGDAVAGLLITGVNIVGGMIIGVGQQNLSFGDAARTYTILSIGEGLVAQIPALLVSTGAALLTTRGSSTDQISVSLGQQLLSRSKPTAIAAAGVGLMSLMPGMPHLALMALAGGVAMLSRNAAKNARDAATNLALPPGAKPGEKGGEKLTPRQELEQLLPVELLSLDVGLDLLPLVDAARNGELLTRIASIRKQLALDLGLIVPPVHVRDDLRLKPGGYRIQISGLRVAQGEVRVGRLLAIDPGGAAAVLGGEAVSEPTFGLPARWINPGDRSRAEALGCTIVDAPTVVATHVTETVRRHAHELLGRHEAQELLEVAAKQNAKVVEELVPHLMPLGELIKVLRNLLQEGISIRDSRSILEALADNAAATKDPGELTELVRQRLARQITSQSSVEGRELRAVVLDPRAEDLFRTGPRAGDPQALSRVTASLEKAAREATDRDEEPLLVVAPDVRRTVSAVAMRHVPGLKVMSYREIDPSVALITRGVVGGVSLEGARGAA